MDQDQNPYASPAVSSSQGSGIHSVEAYGSAYVEGKYLWVGKDFSAPNMCLVTGETIPSAESKKRLNLAYLNPFLYILLFLGILGIILAVVLQKRMTTMIYRSEKERKRRRNSILIGWGIFLFSILLCVASVNLPDNNVLIVLVISGIALFFVSLLWAIIVVPKIKVTGYKKAMFKLKGVHPKVLDVIQSGSRSL